MHACHNGKVVARCAVGKATVSPADDTAKSTSVSGFEKASDPSERIASTTYIKYSYADNVSKI
jgi:hypothetical protein